MDVETYFEAVNRGVGLTAEAEALLGRVVQVMPEGGELNDLLLAPFPTRRTAFLMGGDALELFTNVERREFLLRTGKSERWLEEKRTKRVRLYLIAFESGAGVVTQPATWRGLSELVETEFKDVADRLRPHWQSFMDRSFEELVGADWRRLDDSAIKEDVDHPLHKGVQRFLDEDNTPTAARVFLWHTLGVNQEFRGDGYTYNGSVRGYREYLTTNRPLRDLPYAAIEICF